MKKTQTTLGGIEIEIITANEIMSGTPIESYPWYDCFCRRALYEDMAPGTKVTQVGCGAVPVRLITLWTECGVEGIGIEQVLFCSDLATKLIAYLGLSEHIKIVHGDESLLPLSEDVVLYSPQAKLKLKLQQQIRKRMKRWQGNY